MTMNERVVAMGREAGIEFDFEHAFAVNTFDAHRMLHLAEQDGNVDQLADRFFHAYFTGSQDLSSPEDLAGLAGEVGVDPDRAAEVAAGEEFSEQVRADIELAGQLGISAVPAFIFDRSSGLSGARPVGETRAAIEQALDSAG